MNVTPRQMQILRFIRDYRARRGFSPTMQEMADHLRLSKVTVFEHVVALERKKLLVRGPSHKARSLEISEQARFPDQGAVRCLPLAGRIAAGRPIEALEDDQVIDLQELFSRAQPVFCLRVTGDSMIGDHIQDGDLVVCEQRNHPANGETVVALLKDGEATLKRFYKEKGRIRLQPANPAFEPIFLDSSEVEIQGVVIGLIRQIK